MKIHIENGNPSHIIQYFNKCGHDFFDDIVHIAYNDKCTSTSTFQACICTDILLGLWLCVVY